MTKFTGWLEFFVGRLLLINLLIWNFDTQLVAQEWTLEKDKNGIQVYTKKIEGSAFKAYRAVMSVQTTVAELDKIMRNQAELKTWFDRCTESKRLKKVSDNEFYLYFVNDAPWPVQDRDNIAHAIFEEKADGTLWIHLKGVADYLPSKKNKIRLPEMTAHWEFQPLTDGKIKIVQQAHFDLGGSIPAWMINMAVVDSPYNTMFNLKKKLLKSP